MSFFQNLKQVFKIRGWKICIHLLFYRLWYVLELDLQTWERILQTLNSWVVVKLLFSPWQNLGYYPRNRPVTLHYSRNFQILSKFASPFCLLNSATIWFEKWNFYTITMFCHFVIKWLLLRCSITFYLFSLKKRLIILRKKIDFSHSAWKRLSTIQRQ